MVDEIRMTRRAFVGVGAMALAGCAREQPQGTAEASDKATIADDGASDGLPADEREEKPAEGDGILVAYYSRADENYAGGATEWLEVGHTKVMAGYIAEALGADTYEIVPVEPYPEGYDDCCDVALEEQRSDARPAIAGDMPDVSAYQTVFIGCPIWWGDEPMIVHTFVESVDLEGKTIVPFTTHGGSGLGSVPSSLQAAIPGAHFLDGYAVAGTEVDGARDEVAAWAESLALV